MSDKKCIYPKCKNHQGSSGIDLCKSHRQMQRQGKELRPLRPRAALTSLICTGPECLRASEAKNLCRQHGEQLRRTGELWVIGDSIHRSESSRKAAKEQWGNKTEIERFWTHVERGPMPLWKSSEKLDLGQCLVWTGYVGDPDGYGRFKAAGGETLTHRFIYIETVGDIPGDKEIDHLCHNRVCVNSFHLQAVPRKINIRRGLAGQVNGARQRAKTHCPQGHEYSEVNTRVCRGGRRCRACDRDAHRNKRNNNYLGIENVEDRAS